MLMKILSHSSHSNHRSLNKGNSTPSRILKTFHLSSKRLLQVQFPLFKLLWFVFNIPHLTTKKKATTAGYHFPHWGNRGHPVFPPCLRTWGSPSRSYWKMWQFPPQSPEESSCHQTGSCWNSRINLNNANISELNKNKTELMVLVLKHINRHKHTYKHRVYLLFYVRRRKQQNMFAFSIGL